jgi:hypothetical protein
MSTDIIASTSTTSGTKIDTFGNDVLLLDTDKLYSYVASTDQWSDKGKLTSLHVDADAMTRNSFKQGLPDIATLAGLTVSVYEDSRTANSIRYSIVDDETGAPIVFDTLIATTAERPRVVAVNGNTFLIGWRDTGTSSLDMATISINEPGTLTHRTAVEVGAFIAGPWDLIPYGGANALAIFNITGSSVRLAPISYQGAEGTGLNRMPVPLDIAYIGVNGIAAVTENTGTYIYLALANTTGVRALVVPVTLNAPYHSAEIARTTIRNVTIGTKSDGTGMIFVEFTTPATVAARKNQQISSVAVTFSSTALTVTYARSLHHSGPYQEPATSGR